MRVAFENGLRHLMYFLELELILEERVGSDLAKLLLSFLKEEPKPFIWEMPRPPSSPWDPLCNVDPCDGIDLPLFSP